MPWGGQTNQGTNEIKYNLNCIQVLTYIHRRHVTLPSSSRARDQPILVAAPLLRAMQIQFFLKN